VVAERDAMHRAVLVMGFRPTVRIRKIRRTGRFGELSLCVDQVDGLGCFFEVEQMADAGAAGEVVQAGLDGFVRSLGVEVERCHETYDSLVRLAAVVAP
jgi:adenylate cyclase, class 2